MAAAFTLRCSVQYPRSARLRDSAEPCFPRMLERQAPACAAALHTFINSRRVRMRLMCILFINKCCFWASVRWGNNAPRGQTARVCTGAVKCALPADQPHLRWTFVAVPVSVCILPCDWDPPPPCVSSQVCTRMCICGWETEASYAQTPCCHRGKPIMGACRGTRNTPTTTTTIIIQAGSFPLG